VILFVLLIGSVPISFQEAFVDSC